MIAASSVSMDDADDDDDWTVTLDGQRRVYGSAGACLTDARVYERFVRISSDFRDECTLAAWPLARSSFWLPAGATPKGPLEELAASIFAFHTADYERLSGAARPESSGCEFWCNVTRSELLRSAKPAGDIQLHLDKDERAFAEFDGLVVHPMLSTITYISDKGAPTVVFPGTMLADRDYVREDPSAGALFVPPRSGHHLSFDGRWLHGAPAACLPPAAAADGDYERITFCVNIWINHKPGNCVRFSERPTLPSATLSAFHAPRLRLLDARGSAALRECRESEARRAVVVVAQEGEDQQSGSDNIITLSVEQTETVHEMAIPMPPQLASCLQKGRVVRLAGDGIALRAAVPQP